MSSTLAALQQRKERLDDELKQVEKQVRAGGGCSGDKTTCSRTKSKNFFHFFKWALFLNRKKRFEKNAI
jgi:hypothetical protein